MTETKGFTISIHSMVDVITNSSSVMYTWSDHSPARCREMLQELLHAMGYDRDYIDEMFHITTLCDEGVYTEYAEFNATGVVSEDIPDIMKRVQEGADKPQWMKDCERSTERYSDSPPSNYLYIRAKRSEYNEAAVAICRFLYSPDYEEVYDG